MLSSGSGLGGDDGGSPDVGDVWGIGGTEDDEVVVESSKKSAALFLLRKMGSRRRARGASGARRCARELMFKGDKLPLLSSSLDVLREGLEEWLTL